MPNVPRRRVPNNEPRAPKATAKGEGEDEDEDADIKIEKAAQRDDKSDIVGGAIRIFPHQLVDIDIARADAGRPGLRPVRRS